MFTFIGVSALLITVVAYILLQRKSNVVASPSVSLQTRSEPGTGQSPRKTATFRGVRLIPGQGCCQAAQSLSDLTFSNRDNIRLPLPGCVNNVCLCDTVSIRNRRTAERRKVFDRREELRFTPNNPDRRQNKGRRKEDLTWSGGYAG